MGYTRGPGRVLVEIEAEGLSVLLRDGELRVVFQEEGRPVRMEKAKPSYVHIETWSRALDLDWPERGK